MVVFSAQVDSYLCFLQKISKLSLDRLLNILLVTFFTDEIFKLYSKIPKSNFLFVLTIFSNFFNLIVDGINRIQFRHVKQQLRVDTCQMLGIIGFILIEHVLFLNCEELPSEKSLAARALLNFSCIISELTCLQLYGKSTAKLFYVLWFDLQQKLEQWVFFRRVN